MQIAFFTFYRKKDEVFYGQEPRSGESTSTQCNSRFKKHRNNLSLATHAYYYSFYTFLAQVSNKYIF